MYSKAPSLLRPDARMEVTILLLLQGLVRLRPHSSFVQIAVKYVRSDGRAASLTLFS